MAKAKPKTEYVLVEYDDGEMQGTELLTKKEWQEKASALHAIDCWPCEVEAHGSGSEYGYLRFNSAQDWLQHVTVEPFPAKNVACFLKIHPDGDFGEIPWIETEN